ncbi:MAG: ATP-binding protein [Methanobacterium sp.]|nr:ATP-binding protein [Methanobacterium sp.]
MKGGQIVGGGLKDIYIREKSDSLMELGDLLVAEGDQSDYTIIQVKDIEYRSQIPQSTLELSAGLKLEGYGDNLEVMQPKLRNYLVARAKSLLYVKRTDKNQYIIKSPKRPPSFFNDIQSITNEHLGFLKPDHKKNSIYLGDIRSGSTVKKDVNVHIDLIKSLTHHIFIPATTGRGKSNLVRVMLWSILDSEGAGILVLDPHDEYYGDNLQKGLRHHPQRDEKLEYYSPDTGNPDALTLSINIRKIRPQHFSGIGGFSSAQNEAMRMFYNKYGSDWISEIAKEKDHQILKVMGIDEKTAKVLKRKLETKLGVSAVVDESSPGEKKCVFRSNLFVGGESGLATIQNIVESLEKGKIVIIDSSKLSDFEELFVGSIIASNIFLKYKNYDSKTLKSRPVISIVIEEAPRVLGRDALESGMGNNIYGTIAREGRKFKLGLIAITQLASVIPRAILANMNTKIILGNEMSMERSAIIDSASQDLSDDNRIIASLDKGEAIVSSVFTKFAIPIYTPEFDKFVEDYLSKKPEELKIEGETELIG